METCYSDWGFLWNCFVERKFSAQYILAAFGCWKWTKWLNASKYNTFQNYYGDKYLATYSSPCVHSNNVYYLASYQFTVATKVKINKNLKNLQTGYYSLKLTDVIWVIQFIN